jgi:putative transposase
LCRRYDVTTAGFYAWCRRGESTHAKQDRVLSTEIMRLFVQHRERYGSPRIYRLLVNAGWSVSRRRVARLMRSAGLRAKAVRGYRAKVNVHQFYARHPNLLWTTSVTKTNQVWVGDITYLKIASSWRYLAIVMDQYSRRILAWTLNRRRTSTVSFFHSLKAELTRGVQFPTEHALRTQLAHYIRYYNTARFHSSLGYRSPIAFERSAA